MMQTSPHARRYFQWRWLWQWQSALFALLCLAYASPQLITPAFSETETETEPVLAEQRLHYEMLYENRAVGELEVTIRRHDGGYVVSSTVKPNRLASLFLKALHSSTRFSFGRRDALVLVSGDERVQLSDSRAQRRQFSVDYDKRSIQLSGENISNLMFERGQTLVAAAFPLLLMWRAVQIDENESVEADVFAALTDMEVLETNAQRVRKYRYDAPVLETVSVPAGEFSAWKIPRWRVDRPHERVTVWLKSTSVAPSLLAQTDSEENLSPDLNPNPIPLKIVLTKKRGDRVLQLRETSTL